MDDRIRSLFEDARFFLESYRESRERDHPGSAIVAGIDSLLMQITTVLRGDSDIDQSNLDPRCTLTVTSRTEEGEIKRVEFMLDRRIGRHIRAMTTDGNHLVHINFEMRQRE